MNLSSETIWHLIKMTIGLILIYIILGADSNALIWIGIIVGTYIFFETRSYINLLKKNQDILFMDTIDLSLKTYGKSILVGTIISSLLSISGSAIFSVERIGHFFEGNEYEANYYVKYSFNEDITKYKLGIAEISKEGYGAEETYYFINKISDNDLEIDFDKPCIMELYKKWFKCDSSDKNPDIWLYITGEKLK